MSQSPSGSSASSSSFELVHGQPGRHRHLAVVEGLHGRLLDVVLVDDLAHQLLDEVLQGDQPGGAAVLVDHDGQVVLALLHLAHEPRHPLGLGHEVGGADEVARPARAPWPSRSARIRSLA